VLAYKGEKYLNKEMPRERTKGFPPRANNNRPGEAWWILKARYKPGKKKLSVLRWSTHASN
jgi:hypothetical protein